MEFKRLMTYGAIALMSATVIACSDDNGGGNTPSKGGFFVALTGESAEYAMQIENPATGEYAISQNQVELESTNYTWIFGGEPRTAVGLIYAQGDPGTGVGYQLNSDGEIEAVGAGFQIVSRFTNYGFCDNYAITSVSGKTPVDANGNAEYFYNADGTPVYTTDADGNQVQMERTDGTTFLMIDLDNELALQEKTIKTLNIANNEDQQAVLAGLVDGGNGEFYSGLILSNAFTHSSSSSSVGEVIFPDSCWVAAFDKEMNVKRIYRSGKIGYSAGRNRSRAYGMIDKADDGYVYVFSGSNDANCTLSPGAIRFSPNESDFDSNYYFDIGALSGGLKPIRVWAIAGTKFLVNFWNDAEKLAFTRYAIVDVSAKSLKWVSGDFPSYDNIESVGEPMSYNGKAHIPATATGENPAIYVVDSETGVATKGASFNGATAIDGLGYLTNN
ncbi:MAG: DUF4374 domain-containing protein [Mangrovibacterium sp.]